MCTTRRLKGENPYFQKIVVRARRGARIRIFWKCGLSPFEHRVARMHTTSSYFLAQFEIWVFWKIEAVFQKLQFLENAKEISLKIWFLIFKNDKKMNKNHYLLKSFQKNK